MDVSTAFVFFAGSLTYLFLCLKLLDYVEWSWVYILSPLWMIALVVWWFGIQ